jgi:hypothetical protein
MDVPNTESYEAITKHLGAKVPCYGEPGGCCVDDATNERFCDDGCLLLRVYKAGYLDGAAHTAGQRE